MGESPEERRIRKRRERREYLKRQEEIDRYIAEEIDRDKTGAFAREMDAAFDKEFQELFGQTPYEYGVELDKEMLKGQGVSERDIDEAQRVIKRAAQQAKGGWFSGKNPKKAAKTLKGSSAVKKVAKASKKGKGCAVTLLALASGGLVTLAALIYGAAEAVASVLR